MSQFEATFESKEVSKLLDELLKKTNDIQGRTDEVMAIISAVVFRDVMQHFSEEKGSEGPWKPWSKSYTEFMAKIGKSGNKKLQDTGRLRNSFLPTNYRKTGSDGIVWYNPARTKKGFPYAFAHNEGGPKLPKRDFMWLSSDAISEIESQIVKFLES